MAYTLATVRQRILDDRLDDTTFEPSIVDNFINDTQRAIFNTYELPFMEKTRTDVVSSGASTYVIPSEVQTIQGIKITIPDNNKRDITQLYMPFREFNQAYPVVADNAPGSPYIWTSHGSTIYFSRPTNQNYTIEVWFLKKPDTLDDDADIPEIPEEFSELLVLGAYYRILERNEDFDLASYYKNGEYANILDQLAERYGKRQTGKAMRMSQPQRAYHGRASARR
jgi:hypothetical protein